jgi:cyclase
MHGYDLELIFQVAEAVAIPVIASGVAGCYQHLANAITMGRASPVAAASIFHFTQMIPREAQQFLLGQGFAVRKGL